MSAEHTLDGLANGQSSGFVIQSLRGWFWLFPGYDDPVDVDAPEFATIFPDEESARQRLGNGDKIVSF